MDFRFRAGLALLYFFFHIGPQLRFVATEGGPKVRLERMVNLDGEPVQVAQGSPVRVRIPLEGPVEGALISRLLQP